MAEALVEYQLVTPDGQTVKTSVDFNGKGIATYPNGDVYDGTFVAGLRDCEEGSYTYAPTAKPTEEGAEPVKEVYKGSWKDNQKHGIGRQNYVGLGDYYGNWVNGEKEGEGVMIYVNQDIYSGQWKNGKKDGNGTYIFEATKMKFVGQFRAGNFVNGKWYYPNGSYFDGNFDNNKPKGVGNWNF